MLETDLSHLNRREFLSIVDYVHGQTAINFTKISLMKLFVLDLATFHHALSIVHLVFFHQYRTTVLTLFFFLLFFHSLQLGLIQHQCQEKDVLAVVEGSENSIGWTHHTGTEQWLQTINYNSSLTVTQLRRIKVIHSAISRLLFAPCESFGSGDFQFEQQVDDRTRSNGWIYTRDKLNVWDAEFVFLAEADKS